MKNSKVFSNVIFLVVVVGLVLGQEVRVVVIYLIIVLGRKGGEKFFIFLLDQELVVMINLEIEDKFE